MCKYFKQSFAADHCYTRKRYIKADVKFKMVHSPENVFHFSHVFGNAGKDKFTHLTRTVTKNFRKNDSQNYLTSKIWK